MRKFKKELLTTLSEIAYEMKDINDSLRVIRSAFDFKGAYPTKVLHTKDHAIKEEYDKK